MRVFFHFQQKAFQVGCPLQGLVAVPLPIGPQPVDVSLLFCFHPGGFGIIVLTNDGLVVSLRPDPEQVNRLGLQPPAQVQLIADGFRRTMVSDVTVHHGSDLGHLFRCQCHTPSKVTLPWFFRTLVPCCKRGNFRARELQSCQVCPCRIRPL